MSKRHWIALSLAGSFTLVLLALVATKLTFAEGEAPPDSPAEVDALRAREQELIRRIEQANRRLEEQERTLDEARRQLAAPPPVVAPARQRSHDDEDDDEDDDDGRRASYASRWEHEHDDD